MVIQSKACWSLSSSDTAARNTRNGEAGNSEQCTEKTNPLVALLFFTVNRSPRSIGIQHLSSSGHVSRYEFAQAIIRIMKELSGTPDGWASVKPITFDQYPLPARRPRNPVMSQDKVKRIFGIEIPHWEDQLRTFLAEFAGTADHRREASRSSF